MSSCFRQIAIMTSFRRPILIALDWRFLRQLSISLRTSRSENSHHSRSKKTRFIRIICIADSLRKPRKHGCIKLEERQQSQITICIEVKTPGFEITTSGFEITRKVGFQVPAEITQPFSIQALLCCFEPQQIPHSSETWTIRQRRAEAEASHLRLPHLRGQTTEGRELRQDDVRQADEDHRSPVEGHASDGEGQAAG